MKINLSNRMQSIVNMVISDESVADIGTDHGKIPYYLLANNLSPKVILTDINDGPLDIARNNFSGCFKDSSEFRLGNGLEPLKISEVSSVIIAGMGGELIEEIITKDIKKSKSYKRLILQPRTKSDELRVNLSAVGFKIVNYDLVLERNRICEIFAVEPGILNENYLVSNYLINNKVPLFDDFIKSKISHNERLIESLLRSKQSSSLMIDQLKENNIYYYSLI